MRIVIDMQGAQTESRFRGIGRYSLSIAQAIVKHAANHDVWLVLNAQLPESIPELRIAFRGLIPEKNIRVFDVPDSPTWGSWENFSGEIIREHFLASLAPDVVLLTSVFEGYWAKAVTSIGAYTDGYNTAAILYDLIPLLNQEMYLPVGATELRNYYFRKIEWLKNAGVLLAISDYTRKEGIDNLIIAPDQVVDISTAIGKGFSPTVQVSEGKGLLSRLGINKKMVMYAPGGFDPRKNFDRLIEAYSYLPKSLRSECQLVIVSKVSLEQRQELNKIRDRWDLVDGELILTGYVEDNELVMLYSLAHLFVFPSLHEGFGLPVLEAMACGAPVIGSSTTSIPQVIGWDEALFDPQSAVAIANKIKQSLTDEIFRKKLCEHGLRQSKKFTWDNCALRAIEALELLHTKNISSARQNTNTSKDKLISALANIVGNEKPTEQAISSVASCIAFNEGHAKPQLLLDISTLVQNDAKSGIQRVVRSILKELLIVPPKEFDVQPIYFNEGVYRYANRYCESVFGSKSVAEDFPVDFCQDDIYLSLDLNMHLTSHVHDLHLSLRNRGVQVFFIVYDILLIHRPDWWHEVNVILFKTWLTSVSEVATGLICISEAVADDVRAWIKQNPSKRIHGPLVSSFHLGADVENSQPSKGMPADAEKILNAINVTPSFLMVGTIEPRKGHAQTLAAFENLWEQGIKVNLVIVGKRGWLVDQLVEKLTHHPDLNKRLFWLEGISDEYLESVYAACTCLLAPSEGEGFGLPLIEAAQHKKPIIARDIPVFREVAGSYAFYFVGLEAKCLARAIVDWLALKRNNEEPKSEEMPFLTWRESALQLQKQINSQRNTY